MKNYFQKLFGIFIFAACNVTADENNINSEKDAKSTSHISPAISDILTELNDFNEKINSGKLDREERLRRSALLFENLQKVSLDDIEDLKTLDDADLIKIAKKEFSEINSNWEFHVEKQGALATVIVKMRKNNNQEYNYLGDDFIRKFSMDIFVGTILLRLVPG